ncbi:MAG: murein biosynthesis integral membrane protein MurJ [Deltaproteobacteria bacterium]|nr:murein biosynthesis integral membrane protein MurJ [Deltaproteobacteria bacterium]
MCSSCQGFSVENSSTGHSEKKKVSRAAGVVGFFTLLSRILGLVRDMVVAHLFGAGMAADAFFVAFRIPNLLRRLFAEGSLTIAFIPVFTEYLSNRTRREAMDLARTVLTLLSLILVAVTVIGVLLSPWIVRIQAFGFGGTGAKYDLTVLLTRITFPYILLISLVAFFMGVLNSLRRFAAPAAAPIFLNVGMIAAAYLIAPYFGEPVVGLAIGVLLGGILQVAIQIPSVAASGLRLWPRWDMDHPALRRIGRLMIPAIFGSAVYQVNQFMGTLLASFLAEGSVSWLYYADRLVQFPLGVFAIAISTAALPSLSTQAAHQETDRFGETLTHSLRLVFFVTLPSMVGLIVLGSPIIRVFFERGAFDADTTAMTAQALFFYSVGLWAFSGIRVMVSAFYALQDTRTPVKIAVAAVLTNMALSLILMVPLRHGGLALALSAASSLQFFLLIVFLKRKVALGTFRPVAISGLKNVLAAAVMGGVVYGIRIQWLTVTGGLTHMIAELAGLIAIGIAVYFAVSALLGCREWKALGEVVSPMRRR